MERHALVRHGLKNTLHTIVLLVAMAAILALLGWFLAGAAGLVIAVGFGVASMLFSPRLSPKLLLRMYRARPLSPGQAPTIYRLIDQLAERADLEEAPEVYYMPTRMMNALTVGRNCDAAVGVTDGLLRGLRTDELAGILAHEIAHLANDDTRVMALADTIGRMTSAMSSIGKLLLFLNLPLYLAGAATVPWSIVIVLLVAPVASGLLQLALSRTREFDADLNAIRLTGNPNALARGLQKLEQYNESLLKHMLVPGWGRAEPSLLRTHPHTDRRIERLEQLTESEFPELLDDEHPEVEAHRDHDRVERRPRWQPLGFWF